MDFGLDRVIEMFEVRFGKRPTDAVILLIILAVVGWALGSIYHHLIVPSYHLTLDIVQTGVFAFLDRKITAITKNQVVAGVSWILFVSGVTTIYFRILREQALNSFKKEILKDPEKYIRAIIEKAKELQIISSQAEPPASQGQRQRRSET